MMVYNQSDSDGTDDDDLPPAQVVRSQTVRKGRPSGNGKPSSSLLIDQQIRLLELDAYQSLLRAFTAQSDVVTWHREGLMSNMRKELRVEDELHREMLGKVSNDETLKRIRTWRETGEDPGMPLHHRDTSPSPAVSQSRKRQKVGNVAPIFPPPAPLLKPAPQILPSASGGRGLASGKKSRSKGVADALIVPGRGAPVVGTPGPPSGRGAVGSGRGATPWRNHKGAGPSTDSRVENWVGRRLRIRWPEDNIHYVATVKDYNKESMLHCLVYDSGTPDESIEWVDLKGMDRNDVQWLTDPRTDPVILDGNVPNFTTPERGAGRGMKRGRGAHGGVVGRPKGSGQRGRPANDKTHALAPTPQSRPWRGGAPVEEDRNGTDEKGRRTHIQFPEAEIAALVKEYTEIEQVKDVGKLEVVRQSAAEYEEMLQKGLAALAEYSDDGSEDERVNVVDSPVHSAGPEKEPLSVQDTGNRLDESDEDDDADGDRRDERSEGNNGDHAEREGASDVELDNADDDGD